MLLIFLGSTDGKTATFLPSSDAVPQGDGKCTPSRDACNELTLKPGESAHFEVATASGIKQYVLEVDKLVKRPLGASSASVSELSRAFRESAATGTGPLTRNLERDLGIPKPPNTETHHLSFRTSRGRYLPPPGGRPSASVSRQVVGVR